MGLNSMASLQVSKTVPCKEHLSLSLSLCFRVSLVVTETVDAGLLGEGILQSLIHAWDHLLLPPGSEDQMANVGRVVPAAAGVWVVPIECIHIARKYRLLNLDMTQQDLSNITQVIIWFLCFQMLLNLQQVLKVDFLKWKYSRTNIYVYDILF